VQEYFYYSKEREEKKQTKNDPKFFFCIRPDKIHSEKHSARDIRCWMCCVFISFLILREEKNMEKRKKERKQEMKIQFENDKNIPIIPLSCSK
jgi:hypothetical protein